MTRVVNIVAGWCFRVASEFPDVQERKGREVSCIVLMIGKEIIVCFSLLVEEALSFLNMGPFR